MYVDNFKAFLLFIKTKGINLMPFKFINMKN